MTSYSFLVINTISLQISATNIHCKYPLQYPLQISAAISAANIRYQYLLEILYQMSEAMIPISRDALHYCTITMLFDHNKLVTISPERFDEIWSYVDSVYSKLQQMLLQSALRRGRRCLVMMRLYGVHASFTGNIYFHADISSILILKSKY
ncbi:hypothetical protein EV426DRAFT_591833 [Tirmania nivea]|nr:hypothetical protein EV426DRAFT_591833 [Tirmania nivea]